CAHHPAPSAQACDPGHREHVHRPVQGHNARVDHRHLRTAQHRSCRRLGHRLAVPVRCRDRLCFRRLRFLDLLLRHVPLLNLYGRPAAYRSQEITMTATMEAPQADRTKMTVSDTDVAVDIVNMNKWYGDFHVLRDINLRVMRGERIVIAGPSGSG